MKIIILSGGSGKRLWPLSTECRPKQLLKVLPAEKDKESMLQRIVGQLSSLVDKENILVTTTIKQYEELAEQLKGVSIITEPESRDTFPAIALACSYLYAQSEVDSEEIVAVVSADSFVEIEFYMQLLHLVDIVSEKKAALGLMGVRPYSPSSKFGYILPNSKDSIFNIKSFVEKPDETYAKLLIEEGALWNSGVFVFPISMLLNKLEEKKLPRNYDDLRKVFKMIPKNSFDYEIVENLENILGVTYEGTWDDLGTWDVLTNKLGYQLNGDVQISADCKDLTVLNELNIPIKVLGVSNLVIVATENGILISDKDSSVRLKELIE
ncbi:sugar phosphate nucleotidyltransferase [Viridibacillus arvi]|uniref:sugar phosphate nucleotidyltransferase n=1 Tax=Viridibacillus arvi TaxID=263475 RepID=UPI003CFC46F7